MTTELKSAICVKCKKKNDVVEYMVTARADEEVRKAEGAYLDHFQKTKGKPPQTGPA